MLKGFRCALVAAATLTASTAFGTVFDPNASITGRTVGNINANGAVIMNSAGVPSGSRGGINTQATPAVGVNGEVYSNLNHWEPTPPDGFYHIFGNGPASTISTPPPSRRTTRLAADDITFDAATPVGVNVTQLTFSTFNVNSSGTQAFDINISLYRNDGPGTGAGTLFYRSVAAVTQAAGTLNLWTLSPTAGSLLTSADMLGDPSTNYFWAAISFDNGTNTTTNAQLGNLTQYMSQYTADVGSSDDVFELTNAANNGSANNPGPSVFTFFGGAPATNPPGNFAWEFRVGVPEPTTLSIAGLALMGLAARRRRA